ncbi:MAG: hypothetical protein WAW85_05570 [Gordonia sp. (in: high G+C Gram-positive bacteria)]|uniref:hypothetical protein n=1 Tax=Gordonia sp. (in: high G+C Gram-positive bacteria) TaxID=84139 RepID=UPI003BB7F5B5
MKLSHPRGWLREPHPDLVDQQTALTRMEHLDPVEVPAIDHACNGDWSWAPEGELVC